MRRTVLTILSSSLTLAAAAYQGPQLNDATAPTSHPVSTGVTSPRLVSMARVNIPADELPTTPGNSAKIVLKVNLDETGSPTAVQVIRPINPDVDARVLNAVRQFHWTPAVLNNKTVADEVTLTVELLR